MSFMFLSYAGFFRDYSDPLSVAKYYLECIKNREGFLTYQITAPEGFYPDIRGQRRSYYGLDKASKIEFKLLDKGPQLAHVEVKLVYSDNNAKIVVITLAKKEDNWLVGTLQ